jgi:NAD(P)H-dependent flavin oxidoreductase YrpB (nitropropane dioxygenase family)
VGDSAIQQQAQSDAKEELTSLLPRIPAAGVALQIDGVTISTELLGVRRPMNPGKHRVEARRGDARALADVQLAEKDHQRVVLRLLPPASGTESAAPAASAGPATADNPGVLLPSAAATPDLPEPQRSEKAWVTPVAISVLAIGGASLAASGMAALVAQGKCAGGRCASVSDQELYDPLRTVSSVTFWVGAVLAAGGVATWILAPRIRTGEKANSVSFNITPFAVDVRGAL